MIDRGFEAMIPHAPRKKESEDVFKYDIVLPLFGRVFSLTIKVQNRSDL